MPPRRATFKAPTFAPNTGPLKLTTLVCFLCLLGATAFGQTSRGNYNFLDFQQKPYYFGITLAYNYSDFKVLRSPEFLRNDSIRTVEAVSGPGFNLGIVTNLKIGDHFDVRLLPTLSFAERNLTYDKRRQTGASLDKKIESVFVETPVHIRYKSAPYKDMRMFLISGVKYSFDVANDSRSRQADDLVKIAPTDFQFEIGGGVQFFFPYFIFSPEFKYSHGIGNGLLYDDRLPESRVIDQLISRTFTISLHFEG